jgi:hypothetical protein
MATETETAERQALITRLSALVTSRLVLDGARAAPLAELRRLVAGVEKAAADVAKYGRMQAEAAPGNW